MTRPPAVVVGLDNITGLQTARILAARGIPVTGLAGNVRHFACRTRACVRVLEADLLREELVASLVRLGPQLDDRAALMPCTDLSVLLISRHRAELAPWFHIALPDHAVVEMLMDKVGFLRHALANDLPIPGTVLIEDRDDAERAARTLTYPAVLKPPIKSATWQTHTNLKALQAADGRELLEAYAHVAPWSDTFIAQEWVAGGVDSLYSCNAYFDATAEPLVTFVARKLRQWPPQVGTSSLGEECRDDEVLRQTVRLFGGLDYHGLAYLEMKRDARTGRHLIIEPNIGRPTGRSAIAEAGGVELLQTAYCDMVGAELPAAREQRYGRAKWIDDRRDLQSAVHAIRHGGLTLGAYASSVGGPKTHAVASRSDPLPFVLELVQLAGKAARLLAGRLRALRSRTVRRGSAAGPPGEHSPAARVSTGTRDASR